MRPTTGSNPDRRLVHVGGDWALEFEPRFPLWTDGADQRRRLLLPDGGQVGTSDPAPWVFPVGIRLFKELAPDGVRLETRMSTHSEGGWAAVSCVWSDGGADAVRQLDAAPDVAATPHVVPSAAECLPCHAGRGSFTLGFSATRLPPQTRADPHDAGVLSDAVDAEIDLPPTALAGPGVLHGNCSHGHHAQRDEQRQVTSGCAPNAGEDDGDEPVDFTLPHGLASVDDAPVLQTARWPLDGGADSEALERMAERNTSERPSVGAVAGQPLPDEQRALVVVELRVLRHPPRADLAPDQPRRRPRCFRRVEVEALGRVAALFGGDELGGVAARAVLGEYWLDLLPRNAATVGTLAEVRRELLGGAGSEEQQRTEPCEPARAGGQDHRGRGRPVRVGVSHAKGSYWMRPPRTLVQSAPTLLIALSLTACPADPCADTACVVAEDLAQGLLSVRAVADDDVWVVGSSPAPDAGEGEPGPLAAWWDGDAWTALDTSDWDGLELWWAHVTADEAVLVGTRGTILEYDRASGVLSQAVDAGEGAVFFGVWGATPDDLWAVGEGAERPDEDGDGEPEPALPLLWRRQDGAWAAWEDPTFGPGEPSEIWFKVHGRSTEDLWIVGSGGTALHWNGTALSATTTDTDIDTSTAPLLTVDSSGERPYAVGGAGVGLILEWDGTEWRDRSPEFQAAYNGVCTGPDGAAAAVGRSGGRAIRIDGTWIPDLDRDIESVTLRDYHACAHSPGGALWAVGGRIGSRPLGLGVVTYTGPGTIEPLNSAPGGSSP